MRAFAQHSSTTTLMAKLRYHAKLVVWGQITGRRARGRGGAPIQ